MLADQFIEVAGVSVFHRLELLDGGIEFDHVDGLFGKFLGLPLSRYVVERGGDWIISRAAGGCRLRFFAGHQAYHDDNQPETGGLHDVKPSRVLADLPTSQL